uniref:Uncharacterized protein n=1 Tax=Anguilla anguilla TaxID=7936 RepID=A0A0E9W7T5_ANGAN
MMMKYFINSLSQVLSIARPACPDSALL